MICFSQNDCPGEYFQGGYTIKYYGCGLCTVTMGLSVLERDIVESTDVRDAIFSSCPRLTICDDTGMLYDSFFKGLTSAYCVRVMRIRGRETADKWLNAGAILISGNSSKRLRDADGILHVHGGHTICFYRRDEDGSYLAKDSQYCGGPKCRYSRDDFDTWCSDVENRKGSDKGSLFAIMLSDADRNAYYPDLEHGPEPGDFA